MARYENDNAYAREVIARALRAHHDGAGATATMRQSNRRRARALNKWLSTVGKGYEVMEAAVAVRGEEDGAGKEEEQPRSPEPLAVAAKERADALAKRRQGLHVRREALGLHDLQARIAKQVAEGDWQQVAADSAKAAELSASVMRLGGSPLIHIVPSGPEGREHA